ncbi:hypothetical protein DY000_02019879 [Brassica cretica]|uniref:Aminotransferase-like plant mobile domain-containing protein n=1 Tax=Brassica cretica TaxID=69181 RepID=A0ABQ7CNM6_BRACR|nr:hypothetical protein DY000_02019879 [Brassica cretica]
MKVGIPYSMTLAELWVTDHWVLPPAKSEKQTERITADYIEILFDPHPPSSPRLITPSDEESPLSDPLNQLRLQLYSKWGSLTLLHIDIIDRLNFSLV